MAGDSYAKILFLLQQPFRVFPCRYPGCAHSQYTTVRGLDRHMLFVHGGPPPAPAPPPPAPGPPRTPPSPVSDSNSSDEDTPRVLVQWRPPGIRTEGKAPRMQLGDQFCVERGLDYWFAGARGVPHIHLNDEKKRRLKEAANNATKEQVEKYAQDPLGICMSGNRLKHDYQLAKTRASKSAVLARYAMPGWLWTNPPTAPDVDRGATGPI